MTIQTPLADRVPREMIANLKWRQKIQEMVVGDPQQANIIRDACRRDPIFFMNGFAWTYDPRQEPFPKLPFILYEEFQDEAFLEIIDSIGSHDLLIEKSRDMGASWLCMSAIFWRWLFQPLQSFLFVSRVQDYVDDVANPKTLMWKMDFLLRNLPVWLRPRGYKESEHRRKLHIQNPENDSVIDGESTNTNVARGDRRTAILLDEFAAVEQGPSVLSATRDATKSRIFNSTPQGIGNSFYDLTLTNIRKLRLHWSIHPEKSIGSYTADSEGNLNVLDKENYPEGYHPILDGKVRSPWYDLECSRAATPREIAQELDIDYIGSGAKFFDPEAIQRVIREHARPPVMIGDLDYDSLTAEPGDFREYAEGRLGLWFLLDGEGKPPLDLEFASPKKYILGVDVSAGAGASNSCISGWDTTTCEKVLEYVSPYIRPEELAKQTVAIAKWLGNAFIIWESFGPGEQFSGRIIDIGYSNICLRKSEVSLSRKVTNKLGLAPTGGAKLQWFGNYRDLIESGRYVNQSKAALEETLEYIYSPTGGVVHVRANNKSDPSGAKANHGDRVCADALALYGFSDVKSKPKREKPEVPVGCLAWRRKRIENSKLEKDGTKLLAGW